MTPDEGRTAREPQVAATRTPRPVRGRDAAGRPVPLGSPDAVEPVPEQALPPAQALALARDLLRQGRPFFAHDVLEARWKEAPERERALWQGLAQVCVGLTHEQRGNDVGAARLLRRGATRLESYDGPPYDVTVPDVVARARARAAAVEQGGPRPPVDL
jgi:hypothetical protein